MKIKNVERVAEEILRSSNASRDDDMILYFEVCRRINPMIEGMTFKDVMRQSAIFGIPSFESVSRARRKLVETAPELRGSKRATDARYQKFKEFRDYAQS